MQIKTQIKMNIQHKKMNYKIINKKMIIRKINKINSFKTQT